jgi:hypothetical protein
MLIRVAPNDIGDIFCIYQKYPLLKKEIIPPPLEGETVNPIYLTELISVNDIFNNC